MTREQYSTMEDLVVARWYRRYPMVGHHGLCVGADESFNDMCRSVLMCKVVGHPGPAPTELESYRYVDDRRPRAPYLARNSHIVRDCQVIIAAPRTATEEMRSGTWQTVRLARRAGKQLIVVMPEGTINE